MPSIGIQANHSRDCEEEKRQAFRKGRRMGFWLAKNEKKWNKRVIEQERQKDVFAMRQQEQAMEGYSGMFNEPPPLPPPPPQREESARDRLARRYTSQAINRMNKDDARSALRALGGNPRVGGVYADVEGVKEMLREKVRQILGEA